MHGDISTTQAIDLNSGFCQYFDCDLLPLNFALFSHIFWCSNAKTIFNGFMLRTKRKWPMNNIVDRFPFGDLFISMISNLQSRSHFWSLPIGFLLPRLLLDSFVCTLLDIRNKSLYRNTDEIYFILITLLMNTNQRVIFHSARTYFGLYRAHCIAVCSMHSWYELLLLHRKVKYVNEYISVFRLIEIIQFNTCDMVGEYRGG